MFETERPEDTEPIPQPDGDEPIGDDELPSSVVHASYEGDSEKRIVEIEIDSPMEED